MRIRHPAVAGSWYSGTPNGLRTQLEGCFTHKFGPGKSPQVMEKGPRKVVGLVCPHAGYMYSGPVAAHSYYKLALDGKPDVIIIFSPNHTGRGSALSLMNEGKWRTPLGDAEIDTQIANRILHESRIIDLDDTAHVHEHSIELQLPFLQYLYGSAFKFVPICFLLQDLESSKEVGHAVAKALQEKNALIIASTDLTHYEPQDKAQKKDKAVIAAAIQMDEEHFYSIVESQGISICGYAPTISGIIAARSLGAKKGQLLSYKTSGDITGDFSAVVGYASIAFTKC